MLPGTDGVELMQTVPGLSDLPVIFISGYGRDETIARALEAGADDYVVKPFSPTELTARIRAALRRRANPVPFVLGELAIDYDRRRVSVAGRPVTLTPTEYELLRVLAQGAGRILTHEDLLRQVWAGRGKANPKIVRALAQVLVPVAVDSPRRYTEGLPIGGTTGRSPHILRLASSSNARLQSREYDRRRTRTLAQHGGPGARGPVRGGPQVAVGIAAENTGAQDRDQGRAGGLRSQAIASAARGLIAVIRLGLNEALIRICRAIVSVLLP